MKIVQSTIEKAAYLTLLLVFIALAVEVPAAYRLISTQNRQTQQIKQGVLDLKQQNEVLKSLVNNLVNQENNENTPTKTTTPTTPSFAPSTTPTPTKTATVTPVPSPSSSGDGPSSNPPSNPSNPSLLCSISLHILGC